MIWDEVLRYEIFRQEISADAYIIGTLTYNSLIDLTLFLILWTLPASAVIAFPFALLSKKKLNKNSEFLSTLKWERVVERTIKLAFPKPIEMKLRTRIIASVIFVLILVIIMIIIPV